MWGMQSLTASQATSMLTRDSEAVFSMEPAAVASTT